MVNDGDGPLREAITIADIADIADIAWYCWYHWLLLDILQSDLRVSNGDGPLGEAIAIADIVDIADIRNGSTCENNSKAGEIK